MAAELLRVVFGGLTLLVGVGLVLASVRRLRKAVFLLRARPTPVMDLSPGDVATVDGDVVALTDDRVPAHFRGEEGVAVTTRVKRSSTTSAGGGGGVNRVETWTTDSLYLDTVPFAVADDTGQVEVHPPAWEAFPSESSFRESIRLDRTTVSDDQVSHATAEAFDEYVGEEVAAVAADRQFEQGVLEPGETVTVTGRVVETDDGLAIGHRTSPDAFTLSTASTASAARQFVGGLLLGIVGVPFTAVGGVLLLSLVVGLPLPAPLGFTV